MLKGIDSLCCLLDFATNNLGDELCRKLGKRTARGLPLHNFGHLLPDSADLGGASVCGFLDLVGTSLGKGDCEQA